MPHDPEETVLTDMAVHLGEPTLPTLIAGRYELGGLLGTGGVATVHRATDTRLEREVAIKLLRDSTEDAIDRARFVSEARLLAGLTHPHLVRVLDAGVDDDLPYLALELVPGRTLGEALADGLTPERLAEIGAEVADALAHVHAAGIVHRDVKPGNVLLTGDGAAKLADFGIARIVDDNLHHTRTGMLVGTVAYLAPEQVAGEPASTAIDVYAWGLVLLEGLTARRSYPGTSVESALARLARQPDVPDDLPPNWGPLLRDMTARDPSIRPTAAEVAARLRTLGASTEQTAALLPVSHAAERRSPSPRLVLAGLVAAFALLLGVAAWPLLAGPASSASAHRLPDRSGVAEEPTDPTPVAVVPAIETPPGQGGSAHRATPHRAARPHPPRAHKPKHHGGKRGHKKHGHKKHHR